MAPEFSSRFRTSFLRVRLRSSGFTLPAPGEYGIAMCFLPVDRQQRLVCEGCSSVSRAKKV